jgi:N-acetylglutamate synthase-like GNAT family acetyltransferase
MTRANPKLLSSGTYYVAESEAGSIVGCGGWTRERPGEDAQVGRIGHVRHFGTHPDWIRRGIGSAIFQRCREQARASGISELECYASLNAERFYAALGFERIAVADFELGPGVSLTGCHMRCRL